MNTADMDQRTVYELTRLHMMSQWWHWIVLLLVIATIVTWVAAWYRRDSVELRKGMRWTLFVLRVCAFAGLFFFFLDLEKKTEQRETKNSRVVVLVDTSQSMAITDTDAGDSSGTSRVEQIVERFRQGQILNDLREKHDVLVYAFSEATAPTSIATFAKTRSQDAVATIDSGELLNRSMRETRMLWGIALGAFFVALLLVLAQWFLGSAARGAEGEAWLLLVATVVAIAGFVFAAVASLRHPEISLPVAMGWESPPARVDALEEGSEKRLTDPVVDWAESLQARGAESRIGDAIRAVVEQERGGPIAGVVVFTDGCANAGVDLATAANASQQAGIALFPVGLGSDRLPMNARVVDVEAPARVFPGDNFTIKAYLQINGSSDRQVTVDLKSSDVTDVESDESAGVITEQQKAVVLNEGKLATVEFEVTPDQVGKRLFIVEIPTLTGEVNEADNRASATVEVVERKTRVLLFAGGPTREYRFVRNQLYRDKETTLDILLQTAVESTAQEADRLLDDFPSTAEEMFEYDCLIAFDPDWTKLDDQQIELLERWIAEKAGGMIAIAGPVYMPEWTRDSRGDSRLTPIRSLYPVTFYSRVASSIQLGRTKSDVPWPLKLTEAGMSAPFMKLTDDDDQTPVWQQFPGVYGYYAVKDAKPGATVYAYFSDPQTEVDEQLPVYLADQFYGAGRVAFLASGEMWRLRALDDAYFDRFYTKLIRHVSQGRLLRDSSRGVLLVDKERCALGDTVVVRAVLSNAQFDPLVQEKIDAVIVLPNGLRRPLVLRPAKQETREGVYSGQFTALHEGEIRIELEIPDSNNEILARDIRVRVPQLEIENPRRNDAGLSELAAATGGTYFVGIDDAVNSGDRSLMEQLPSMDQETYLPGTADDDFQQRLMTWLLVFICGALCVEWLLRRLAKLA